MSSDTATPMAKHLPPVCAAGMMVLCRERVKHSRNGYPPHGSQSGGKLLRPAWMTKCVTSGHEIQYLLSNLIEDYTMRLTPAFTLTGLLGFCLALSLGANASQGGPFPELVSAVELEDSLRDAAAAGRQSGKNLLVVLGANWCHDSKNFVTRKMTDPSVAPLLESRYHTLLVNVGMYEQLQAQLDVLDIPALYGTPTVIAVDAASMQVLNRDSLDTWRSSETRSAQEAAEYFTQLPVAPRENAEVSAPLAAAMAEIDQFEVAQGRRITQAFGELGELMAAIYPEPPTTEFQEKWDNLGAMRGPLPDDLRALRASAASQDAQGARPIVLVYPTYRLFTDS
jgi:hypothetical protein